MMPPENAAASGSWPEASGTHNHEPFPTSIGHNSGTDLRWCPRCLAVAPPIRPDINDCGCSWHCPGCLDELVRAS